MHFTRAAGLVSLLHLQTRFDFIFRSANTIVNIHPSLPVNTAITQKMPTHSTRIPMLRACTRCSVQCTRAFLT